MNSLQLLCLEGVPLFEQLQLEEALLRAGTGNWGILNYNTPHEAIVLGISGSIEDDIHHQRYKAKPLPLIRRFSGGGTVVVDHNTLFFTLILDDSLLNPQLNSRCPKKFIAWVGSLLAPAFCPLDFQVRDNDFTLNDLKIGGNAQYFTKSRRLHHTTFLWGYSPENMALLSHPKKQPAYRGQREHTSFCTTLAPHFTSKQQLLRQIEGALQQQFRLERCARDDVKHILHLEHRQSVAWCKHPSIQV